jgi:hypothetical protein
MSTVPVRVGRDTQRSGYVVHEGTAARFQREVNVSIRARTFTRKVVLEGDELVASWGL